MSILSKSKRLNKNLSLFSVYTLATGATLSSGFFLLPGLAAKMAGPAIVFSYLLAILPLLPGIFSKIELATAMPRSGGEYYYLERSLGPLVGTVAGLGTWFGLVLKTAFALIGISAYLGFFFPHLPMKPFVVGSAIIFGLINLWGSGKSSLFQTVLVLGLLLLLLWFTATGLSQLELSYFNGLLNQQPSQVFAAAGLVCVSFMGMTNVASVAEEVKNPERNLPLGIFLALLTAIGIYGLGTLVIVGLVPPQQLYTGTVPTLRPVAVAAEVMAGHRGAVVMTIAALLAFLSVANVGILSASRYPLAMSRDQLLPSWFGHLNNRKTPSHAIIATVGFLLVFVLAFDPMTIAKLGSAFLLLLFALNCLAVLVMRESKIQSYDPSFRTPLYPGLQIVGIIGPLIFILGMGWFPILFCAILIGVGTTWYFYYGHPRVDRTGALAKLLNRNKYQTFDGLDRELRSILKEKGLRAYDPYDEIVAEAKVIDFHHQVHFEELLKQASHYLAKQLPLSTEQLAKQFIEGTRIGATPVSKGVALPHLRVPDLQHPLMILCRVFKGVHIEVETNSVRPATTEPIYIVIFLVSSETNASQHLRILAQIAEHVDNPDFLDRWLKAADASALREILLRNDRFLKIQVASNTPSSALINRPLHHLNLPENTLIALINRDNQMIVPRGDTILREGDQLTIVGIPQGLQIIRTRFVDQQSFSDQN